MRCSYVSSGWQSVLHCEPLFARRRPTGREFFHVGSSRNRRQLHVFGSRARAGLPACVDRRSQGTLLRFSLFSFQVASKELESSKQQLAAEACSFGSGKHREFAEAPTLSGKRPVYRSCKVLRT